MFFCCVMERNVIHNLFVLIDADMVLVCLVNTCLHVPGRVAQSVGHLTHKSGILGLIPSLAT